MNEDNLNMEVRKFLKKVGISSQRLLENEIIEADKKGLISPGSIIDVEMTLSIKSLNFKNAVLGQIKVE